MAEFTHIVFDLDGTLTDSRQGIANALKYALNKMQLNGYSDELLGQFLGPPLQQGFKNLFGLNDRQTEMAVEYFRHYYSEKGLFENRPYDGICELLETLHFSGRNVFIATSKLEKYAWQIVRHFGFDRYLTDLKGADYGGVHAGKSHLVENLLQRNRLTGKPGVVLIGDTRFDLEASRENEIAGIAVAYGYGNSDELLSLQPDYFVEDVDELAELLLL